MYALPSGIDTDCPELNMLWARFAANLLKRQGLLIPDAEEDLNWHAFLGHSIDMQGFRAAEFAGVDPLSRSTPSGFKPLNQRGIGIRELGALWEIETIREHLLEVTKPGRKDPMTATYDVLTGSGGDNGRSLAEALVTFPWLKRHKFVRALLENSSRLREYDYSFRGWLIHECATLGVSVFPPATFRQLVHLGTSHLTLERALRTRLEQTFYLVGPTMAPYILCDWQLWLWNEERTGLFESFKLDAFHQKFVAHYGREKIPPDEDGFAEWWHRHCPDIPPRLANECIWLGIEHKLVS